MDKVVISLVFVCKIMILCSIRPLRDELRGGGLSHRSVTVTENA